MLKRLLDIFLSALGLVVASPVLLIFMLAVWLQDFHSPFYVAPRVGRGGKTFKMVKLRSMVSNADRTGVDSTKSDDNRITLVGRIIRKCKLDELTQLWNVFCGHMSLVGPRPQVLRDVELYSDAERRLLTVRPGITDFASIVFADEGDILEGKDDPDLTYQQLIRPWKSRLGLFYIDNQSASLDFKLVFLTVMNAINRREALDRVNKILTDIEADSQLASVALRAQELEPFPPPGCESIVTSRRVS